MKTKEITFILPDDGKPLADTCIYLDVDEAMGRVCGFIGTSATWSGKYFLHELSKVVGIEESKIRILIHAHLDEFLDRGKIDEVCEPQNEDHQ